MILLFVLFLVILGLGIGLTICFRTRNHQYWSCNKNTCQKDKDGEFTSKAACHSNCPAKYTPVQQSPSTSTESLNSYICNHGNCVRVDGKQGVYASKEACHQNCHNINNVYNPFYQPQSLYMHPWDAWRRRYRLHRLDRDTPYRYKYKYKHDTAKP